MEILFSIVYGQLHILAYITGISYQEANILVYYILIPYSYLVLVDKIFDFHYLKTAFAIFLMFTIPLLGNLHTFCDELFEKSADFLLSFEKINLSYTEASVFICVFGVLFIYGLLFWLNYKVQSLRSNKIINECSSK
jgi:hypothetical protein